MKSLVVVCCVVVSTVIFMVISLGYLHSADYQHGHFDQSVEFENEISSLPKHLHGPSINSCFLFRNKPWFLDLERNKTRTWGTCLYNVTIAKGYEKGHWTGEEHFYIGGSEVPSFSDRYSQAFGKNGGRVVQGSMALLRRWHQLTEALGIVYTISHGTMLGYCRTGSVIPWDYDLDCLIRPKDYQKLGSFFLNPDAEEFASLKDILEWKVIKRWAGHHHLIEITMRQNNWAGYLQFGRKKIFAKGDDGGKFGFTTYGGEGTWIDIFTIEEIRESRSKRVRYETYKGVVFGPGDVHSLSDFQAVDFCGVLTRFPRGMVPGGKLCEKWMSAMYNKGPSWDRKAHPSMKETETLPIYHFLGSNSDDKNIITERFQEISCDERPVL